MNNIIDFKTKENVENIKQSTSSILKEEQNNKIVQLKSFCFLKRHMKKHSACKFSFELRRGLVIKIHELRKQKFLEIENILGKDSKNLNKIFQEILDYTSICIDYVLYEEVSTVELLNKYTEFKNNLQTKFIF